MRAPLPLYQCSKAAVRRVLQAMMRRAANAILRLMDQPIPVVGVEKHGFLHISIPVGMLQCNCSIIGDPVTREALVVDPGQEPR